MACARGAGIGGEPRTVSRDACAARARLFVPEPRRAGRADCALAAEPSAAVGALQLQPLHAVVQGLLGQAHGHGAGGHVAGVAALGFGNQRVLKLLELLVERALRLGGAAANP